jgi:maltooligosyltrehalose synthase
MADTHDFLTRLCRMYMSLFAIIIQKIQGIKNMLNDYWSTHGTVLYHILQKHIESEFFKYQDLYTFSILWLNQKRLTKTMAGSGEVNPNFMSSILPMVNVIVHVND